MKAAEQICTCADLPWPPLTQKVAIVPLFNPPPPNQYTLKSATGSTCCANLPPLTNMFAERCPVCRLARKLCAIHACVMSKPGHTSPHCVTNKFATVLLCEIQHQASFAAFPAHAVSSEHNPQPRRWAHCCTIVVQTAVGQYQLLYAYQWGLYAARQSGHAQPSWWSPQLVTGTHTVHCCPRHPYCHFCCTSYVCITPLILELAVLESENSASTASAHSGLSFTLPRAAAPWPAPHPDPSGGNAWNARSCRSGCTTAGLAGHPTQCGLRTHSSAFLTSACCGQASVRSFLPPKLVRLHAPLSPLVTMSAPAAAPAAPKASKSKKSSQHSYVDLVKDAIVDLKERNGSSLPAIKKALEPKAGALGAGWEKRLSLAIKAMVKSGKLTRVKVGVISSLHPLYLTGATPGQRGPHAPAHSSSSCPPARVISTPRTRRQRRRGCGAAHFQTARAVNRKPLLTATSGRHPAPSG
eukprot:350077-Chlamydomonas_euryale.AAC.13